MTDNEKKANAAHDELARILEYCNRVRALWDVARDIEKVYDDMEPLFQEIISRDNE